MKEFIEVYERTFDIINSMIQVEPYCTTEEIKLRYENFAKEEKGNFFSILLVRLSKGKYDREKASEFFKDIAVQANFKERIIAVNASPNSNIRQEHKAYFHAEHQHLCLDIVHYEEGIDIVLSNNDRVVRPEFPDTTLTESVNPTENALLEEELLIEGFLRGKSYKKELDDLKGKLSMLGHIEVLDINKLFHPSYLPVFRQRMDGIKFNGYTYNYANQYEYNAILRVAMRAVEEARKSQKQIPDIIFGMTLIEHKGVMRPMLLAYNKKYHTVVATYSFLIKTIKDEYSIVFAEIYGKGLPQLIKDIEALRKLLMVTISYPIH